MFENNDCFIFFKERGPKLLSPEQNIQLQHQEALLLKCGHHFLDLLREKEDKKIEVIVVHLYPRC